MSENICFDILWKISLIFYGDEKMKKTCIIVFLFLFITTATGCADSTKPIVDEPVIKEPTVILNQGSDKEETDDPKKKSGLESPIVFDFTELSENDFPRGKWSLNQLIEKYGSPEKIIASYWPELGCQTVDVDIFFRDVAMKFWPEDVSSFSFYYEVGEPVANSNVVEYKLNEEDKNIELELRQSVFYDTSLELPNGIYIGQSMKSEIISAYPENATYPYYGTSGQGDGKNTNVVWVYYGFRDENGDLPIFKNPIGTSVCYYLDDSDVLRSVEITWRGLIL